MVHSVVPVTGSTGLFAVLDRDLAERIARAHQRLVLRNGDIVYLETITRARTPLSRLDPGFRLIFLGVDQNGMIVSQ